MRELALKMAFSASLVVAHLSEFAAKRLCGHHVGYFANLFGSQQPQAVSLQLEPLLHQVGFEFDDLVIHLGQFLLVHLS